MQHCYVGPGEGREDPRPGAGDNSAREEQKKTLPEGEMLSLQYWSGGRVQENRAWV